MTEFILQYDEPTRPAGSISWPMRVGVPFANGAHTSTGTFRLSHNGGERIPVAATEALQWPSNNSLQWVHLDWIQRFPQTIPEVQFYTGGEEGTNAGTLSVTDGNTSITVNTGVMTFQVSKTTYNGPEQITFGGTGTTNTASAYWRDTDGTSYYADEATPTSVAIDASNSQRVTIKAEGFYQAESSAVDMCKYIHYITAWRGLPYIRIYHSFIWNQHFHMTATLNTTSDVFTTCRSSANTAVAHNWPTGTPLTIHAVTTIPASTPQVVSSPLAGTSDTVYYWRSVSSTTGALYETAEDAEADADRIDFTNTGSGRITLTRPEPQLAQYGIAWALDITGSSCKTGCYVDGVDTPVTTAVTDNTVSAMNVDADTQDIDGEAAELSGWQSIENGSAAGLGIAVRDFANQSPCELLCSSTTAEIKLWSNAGDADPLSWRFVDRAEPSNLSVSSQNQGWLNNTNNEPDPFGVQKTHEIWLFPASANNGNLVNDYVQNPPACLADPEYHATTEVDRFFSPASQTPAAYQVIETGISRLIDFLIEQRNNLTSDKESLNWGDVRLFDQSNRTYDNNGYDYSILPWIMWKRTGERKYLLEAERNSRHVMDVDTCHLDSGTAGTHFQQPGATYEYSALHWTTGPSIQVYWCHPSYLLSYYCLTGYEPARDALDELANTWETVYSWDVNPAGNPANCSREQYGRIDSLWTLFRWTKDSGALEGCSDWADFYLTAQALGTERTDRTNLFLGNVFYYMWIEHLYDYAIHDERTDVLSAIVDQVRDFEWLGETSFNQNSFKSTGTNSSRYDRIRRSLYPFVMGYEQTGSPSYLSYALERNKLKFQAIQESGSVSGQDFTGWSGVARIYWPEMAQGALAALAAYVNADEPTVSLPHINLPLLGSETISTTVGSYTYKAQHKLKVLKSTDAIAQVRLIMKNVNLAAIEYKTSQELWGNFRAVITKPDSSTETISLNQIAGSAATANFDDVTFPLVGDAGVYTILVQGEPEFVSLVPLTDATGLVVERATANISMEMIYGPASIFFKLQQNAYTPVIDELSSTWAGWVRPLRILDADGAEIAEWLYDDSTSKSLSSMTVAQRAQVLELSKGHVEYSHATLGSEMGVSISNCEPYFSVTRAQWFNPTDSDLLPDSAGVGKAKVGRGRRARRRR